MKPQRLAPFATVVAVIIAVVAVVAGVSLLSRDGRGSGPPVLRLAAAAQEGVPAYGSVMSARDSAAGAYRLVGTLPTGPSEARIRDLPAAAATVDTVRALAKALGVTAIPQRVDGSWKAGDLVVRDLPGNPWTFGTACGPDTPVSSDAGVTNVFPSVCAGGTVSSGTVSSGTATVGPGNPGIVAPGSAGTVTPETSVVPETGASGGSTADNPGTVDPGTGTSGGSLGSPGAVGGCPSLPPGTTSIACGEPAPPSKPRPPDPVLLTTAQALAATANLRDALGLTSSPTRVEGLSVIVEPLVGSLPTEGIPTVLQLSGKAELVGANGFLSTGLEGDVYPLRTARQAFDAIPVFAMGMPCAASGCPEGPAITGARLGLSRVDLDKGAAALLPAWLYSVQGSSVPLVALAVADRFLSDPATTGGGTGPGGKPTPGPGTEPGIKPGTEPGIKPGTEPGIDPGPDGSVPPQPPISTKPADPSGRESFGFDGAYADSDPLVLVVRYGDSGSCPSQAVRHTVVAEPDRIIVTLTRTAMPAEQVCTMDYQAKLVRVTLSEPLGNRKVIDGTREEPVAVSTGTPPLG